MYSQSLNGYSAYSGPIGSDSMPKIPKRYKSLHCALTAHGKVRYELVRMPFTSRIVLALFSAPVHFVYQPLDSAAGLHTSVSNRPFI